MGTQQEAAFYNQTRNTLGTYWTSDNEAAENAKAPTRAQLAFDAHAKAVTDLIYEMRIITQIGYMWPTKGDDRISRMVDLVADLKRELSVLAIEGYRP